MVGSQGGAGGGGDVKHRGNWQDIHTLEKMGMGPHPVGPCKPSKECGSKAS